MSDKPENPEMKLRQVVQRDGRYPLAAFAFLHEGLGRAVREIHGQGDEGGEPKVRHVSGQQLCLALRNEAVERWGLLARTVLARWNIRATGDFGNMVYMLVDNDLMQTAAGDCREDFDNVFDFEEAFSPDRVFEGDA